jgi:hypothetical protein
MTNTSDPGPSRAVRAWDTFWFRRVPPHSYALMRILFGVIGVASVLAMTPVDQFWTPDGLFQLPLNQANPRTWLIGLGMGTAIGWTIFWVQLISFVALTAGYRTGAATLLSFASSGFLPSWNHLPLSSAHQVVVVVLFCLIWVDAGRVWSVDAWRACKGGKEPADERASEPIWPLRLIRFQVALIYFNSGLWKFNGELWRDGSAVHYASSLNVFHRFPFELPASLDLLTTVGTYVTLAWEIAFPVLLLHRWTRTLALVLGVLLHAGMAATLELGPFSAIMIASYAAFARPESVTRLSWSLPRWRRRRERSPVTGEEDVSKVAP